MRHILCGAAALLLAIVVLPVRGQDTKENKPDLKKDVQEPAPKKDQDKKDQDKKEPEKKETDKKEPEKKEPEKKEPEKKEPEKKEPEKKKELPSTEKLLTVGQVTGKILTVVESKKSIRLQVTLPKVDTGSLQAMAQAQQEMQQAYLQRDPNQRIQAIRNAQQKYLQAQQKLYTTENKEIELQTIDEVKVRTANPPERFDEKGQVKRYTAQELRELKGTDRHPGYPAEFGDLHEGQIVTVTLVRKKDAPGQLPTLPPVKPRGKDAAIAAALMGDNLPHIGQIMILQEPK